VRKRFLCESERVIYQPFDRNQWLSLKSLICSLMHAIAFSQNVSSSSSRLILPSTVLHFYVLLSMSPDNKDFLSSIDNMCNESNTVHAHNWRSHTHKWHNCEETTQTKLLSAFIIYFEYKEWFYGGGVWFWIESWWLWLIFDESWEKPGNKTNKFASCEKTIWEGIVNGFSVKKEHGEYWKTEIN
jgi:hypothetical protein